MTATKTLLALKSSNCAKLSALPHPLIVEGCASAGNTAPCCNGSYCPPRILFVCAFSTLGFVEENYVFFCSMQVYTVTLCLHMGVSQSPICQWLSEGFPPPTINNGPFKSVKYVR